MKRFNGWIRTLFAAFLFLAFLPQFTFAQPGDPGFLGRVGSTEVTAVVIVLDRHTHSLWVYWIRKDANARHAQPWPKFWKDSCVLSDLPCTDAAWRKIPSGTAIVVPAEPEQASFVLSDLRSVAEEMTDLQSERSAFKEQVKHLKEVIDQMTRTIFWFMVALGLFAAVLLVLAAVYVTSSGKNLLALRARDRTIEDMGSRLDVSRRTAKEACESGCCQAEAPSSPGVSPGARVEDIVPRRDLT